jgi:YbbR domain-containing protein
MSSKKVVQSLFFENRNYKIVALLVSMVLWITILGRKDLVYAKDVDLQILLAPNYSVVNRLKNKVSVKVKGSRTGLKKFMKNSEAVTLDLGNVQEGWSEIKINESDISLPIGVNVISINPNRIKVKIKRAPVKATE